MTRLEMYREFMRGCSNTQMAGRHPATCRACLVAFLRAFIRGPQR